MHSGSLEAGFLTRIYRSHQDHVQATRAFRFPTLEQHKSHASNDLLAALEKRDPVMATAAGLLRQVNHAIGELNAIHDLQQEDKVKREQYGTITEYAKLVRDRGVMLRNAVSLARDAMIRCPGMPREDRERLIQRLQETKARARATYKHLIDEMMEQMPDCYEPKGKNRGDFREIDDLHAKINLLKEDFDSRCEDASRREEELARRQQERPAAPALPTGLAKWTAPMLRELRKTLPAPKSMSIDTSSSKFTRLEAQLIDNECPICKGRFNEPALITECKHVACFRCAVVFVDDEEKCPTCGERACPEDLLLLKVTKVDGHSVSGDDKSRGNRRRG